VMGIKLVQIYCFCLGGQACESFVTANKTNLLDLAE